MMSSTLKKHIGCTAALHFLAVNHQIEIQRLDIFVAVYRNKGADSGRRVETFAKFPRIARFAEFPLQVTGGKVNAYRQCIIITTGKTGRNILSQTVDAYYKLRLIMYFIRKSGIKNGLPSFRIAESGFMKITGSLFTDVCPRLLIVQGIVHSYGNNLHYLISLKLRRLNITAR